MSFNKSHMISHSYSILSMSLLYHFKDMITFFMKQWSHDAEHDPFGGNLSHTGITLHLFVSDIAIFALKRDVKLQLTNITFAMMVYQIFQKWRATKFYKCWHTIRPHRCRFIWLTRVQKPNSISICSAICAQLTTRCLWACPGTSLLLKIASLHDRCGHHLIHSYFSPQRYGITVQTWPISYRYVCTVML